MIAQAQGGAKELSRAEARILQMEEAAKAERIAERERRKAQFTVIDCGKRAFDAWWRERIACRQRNHVELLQIRLDPNCRGDTSTDEILISAWRDEETGKAYLRRDKLRKDEACLYELVNYNELIGSPLLSELQKNAKRAYRRYNATEAFFRSRRRF